MTEKRFAEFEFRMSENVEIPKTNLVVHPVIQRSVE